MAIVDDFATISRRLRELQSRAAAGSDASFEIDRWRDLARETARAYVEDRRRGPLRSTSGHDTPSPGARSRN